jgi:hypothetical protein
MNTRRQLAKIFQKENFEEVLFIKYNDCKIFYRFRMLHFFELYLHSVLKRWGLGYPENCVIAVYEKKAG